MTEGDIKRIYTRARSEADTLGEFWSKQIRALCGEVMRLSAELDQLAGIEAKNIQSSKVIRERDGARSALHDALRILSSGLSTSPRSKCHCYGWKPCWLHGDGAKLLGVNGAARLVE